jgi:Tol biopolymer transport system component
MATVYLAEDLRHSRNVALKVLRPEVAAAIGADRFISEIRTTAHLQHPHILPLFDSGRLVGSPEAGQELLYYVMPFVEGESLRQRLTREKQLPVAEAVRLAGEVADALDYAHRRGVLHRDIKPENILLHDGHALVADFGIALALSRAEGEGRLTQTGFSLGTPQYMSPEQAMGDRELDARTDIYALGATLYEMLTGEAPHTGPTARVILARASTEKPRPVRDVRDTVPAYVDAAVLAALSPLPADRYASGAEFARALRQEMPRSVIGTAGDAPHAVAGFHFKTWQIGTTVLLLLIATALGTRWWVERDAVHAAAAPIRLLLPLPPGQLLRSGPLPFEIAQDGSAMAYAAQAGGTSWLFLRELREATERRLAGTEGAEQPFFSPNGEWIGFVAQGKLWKVARSGGAPVPLAAVRSVCGATWTTQELIYFAECDSVLRRVSSRGGDDRVVPLTREASPGGDSSAGTEVLSNLRWPVSLPDGGHLLAAVRQEVGIVTIATGTFRPLMPGIQARYIATGHLAFDGGEGRIRVVPFDIDRLEVRGEAVPAFEAFRGPDNGASYFTVSENGTLLFVAGGFERELILLDRTGRRSPPEMEKRGYRFPRFSPDGRLIVVTVDPRPPDLWIVDAARGQATRLTTDGGNLRAIWHPDGDRIAFSGRGGLSWRSRKGDETRVFIRDAARTPVYPGAWTADGLVLAFRGTGRGLYDLVRLNPGDSALTPLVATAADERQPVLSPDGAWFAYTSDRSGTNEVYVRALDGRGVGDQVSLGGGQDPRWTNSGRELLYRRGTSIVAVEVRTRPTFQTSGSPRELFVAPYDFTQVDNWDVTPDGQRFVFVLNEGVGRGFNVVLNWFGELRSSSVPPAGTRP